MKNNDTGFFGRPWVLRIISLCLALFLFFYVNGSFLRQTTRQGNESALMSNKTATMKVPLQVTVNSQRYVVTGYPQSVRLKVSGPAALVTTTANTQNFKVYLNLNGLGVGHHRVKVRVSGLNSELKAQLTPATVNVDLQPRSTITAPVVVQLSDRAVASGFQLGKPKPSMQNVQISGAKSEVAKVDKVIAYVSVPRGLNTTLRRQVTLQALDKHGRTLNVVIMPDAITVTVPVSGGPNADGSTSSAAGTGSSDDNQSSSQTGNSSVDATSSNGTSSQLSSSSSSN